MISVERTLYTTSTGFPSPFSLSPHLTYSALLFRISHSFNLPFIPSIQLTIHDYNDWGQSLFQLRGDDETPSRCRRVIDDFNSFYPFKPFPTVCFMRLVSLFIAFRRFSSLFVALVRLLCAFLMLSCAFCALCRAFLAPLVRFVRLYCAFFAFLCCYYAF